MKKVDSSVFMDRHYFASAKMDHHALQSKARDDNKKADSRKNATILNTHKGGRIFDEKL